MKLSKLLSPVSSRIKLEMDKYNIKPSPQKQIISEDKQNKVHTVGPVVRSERASFRTSEASTPKDGKPLKVTDNRGLNSQMSS
jgi:hypothetical protein